MIPQSTKLLSIITLILAIWAGFALYKSGKTNTLASEDAQFAVSDSGTVSKIVLKTQDNNELTISKSIDKWLVNNSINADDEKITNLLNFVYKAQVKRPVYKEQVGSIIEQLKSNGLKINYLSEKGFIKSFWVINIEGQREEVIALMDGFQIPYVVQVPGFNGDLSQIFKPEPQDWKTRILFSSKAQAIESLKVNFDKSELNSFEIVKSGNRHLVKEVEKADSLRLYSYLQLYESVTIKEWLKTSNNKLRDSLLTQAPAFEISLTDKNPTKSNTIKIYFNDGQKGNIYGLAGPKNEPCIIRTSIFEYLLQKRSFFEPKK